MSVLSDFPDHSNRPNMHQLIQDIKKKKELQEIDDAFVKDILHKVLTQVPTIKKALADSPNPKSAAYKLAITKTREQLRKSYGLFRTTKEQQILPQFLQGSQTSLALINSILSSHASTKERLALYPYLYQQIFAITGKPSTILDLGCGLNPFSVGHMGLSKLRYYAYDLNTLEIDALNHFFSLYAQKHRSFQGQAAILNILNTAEVAKLPLSKVCFLFKVTEVLESKNHKNSELLIQAIPADFVVVSFSTKTMSGKRMTAPGRRWMEWMCNRLQYKFTKLEVGQELVYVIKKG